LSSGSRFMSGSSDMTSEAALWTASECTRGSRGAAACMHTDVCMCAAAWLLAALPVILDLATTTEYARSSYSCTAVRTTASFLLMHAVARPVRTTVRPVQYVRRNARGMHAAKWAANWASRLERYGMLCFGLRFGLYW
jgi:predicted kinase